MQEREAGQGGVDLPALKALAEKQPDLRPSAYGPSWEEMYAYLVDLVSGDDSHGAKVVCPAWSRDADEEQSARDLATFVAAAKPTILALIAEAESTKARRCETCAEWYPDATPWTMIGSTTPWCHYFGCGGDEGYVQATAPDFCCNQWRAQSGRESQ